MTIDTHHHLWDLDIREQPWLAGPGMEPLRRDFAPADLHAALAGSTVDSTVLVQTVPDDHETPELLVLAETVACVAGVVGWVDLTARNVRERLAELLAHPAGRWLRGIRHPADREPDPEWLCRPEVQSGLAAVDDAGLVYELLVGPEQLPAAIKSVARFPQLTFVLEHCGKPPIASGEFEPWASHVRELAQFPHVLCKLSGLATRDDWTQWTADRIRPYSDLVFEAFGATRVMFGSDWPVCLLAARYGQVLDLAGQLTSELGPAERAAVFERTAKHIYRL